MRVALLGYGTVGSGVYELIQKNTSAVKTNFDRELEVVKILVKNLDKYKSHEAFHLFTNNFDDLANANIDIAIETIGGISPTGDYLKYFLSHGIPVITANKDLIAEIGSELIEIAREHNTILSFEASVGGGIPILKPLQESLAGNEIKNISAVLNGTTNYILTKMYEDNMGYDEALSLAQSMGFAEADPTSDVEGYDAMRKLVILSTIGYKKHIRWTDLPLEGISRVTARDIAFAKDENYKIKLIAFSEDMGDAIYGTVRPVFITQQSKYAKIDNEFNAVLVEGDAVGELMFTGKGAGKYPTASAILGDLMDIIQNKKILPSYIYQDEVRIIRYYPKEAKYVVRFQAKDLNLLAAKLFSLFSDHGLKLTLASESQSLYVQVTESNEKTLLDKLNQITDTFNCSYIHYLVYDK
ncbi:MAG: homoserine dehydrogenase [Clostridiales bacterium]|nr:homoserine dehydrogenase [Clostridiales bacterium]